MTVKNDGIRNSFNKKGLLYSGVLTGLSCTVYVLVSICEYIPISLAVYGPEKRVESCLRSKTRTNFGGLRDLRLAIYLLMPDRI